MSDTTPPVVEIVSEETVILPAAVPFYKNRRTLATVALVALGTAAAAFAATKFLSDDNDADDADSSNDFSTEEIV
jgi:hypothetical protein